MDYDAITLDTSIFEQHGLYLEKGLLDQLSQFKTGSADFILSEIVVRELHRHLAVKVQEARVALESALRRSDDASLLTQDALANIKAALGKLSSPEAMAKERLKKFVDKCGCNIIGIEPHATLAQLVKGYFDSTPPFEDAGKKRKEFPDAMALYSLDSWAEKNGKKILVLSNDKGWEDYAKTSKRLVVEKDLALALEKFQKFGAKAEKIINALLTKVDTGQATDLHDRLSSEIESAVDQMELHPEADAAFHYEGDFVEVALKEYEFLKDAEGAYSFHLVQVGRNKISIELAAHIKIKANCSFELSVWDSIDKEYVAMGGQDAETEEEFDGSILITFEGDFEGDADDIHVGEVQLTDSIDTINFGSLSLDDYGDD